MKKITLNIENQNIQFNREIISTFFIENKVLNNWDESFYIDSHLKEMHFKNFDINQIEKLLSINTEVSVIYSNNRKNLDFSKTSKMGFILTKNTISIEITLLKHFLTLSKIDYLWLHLETFYWDLGGEGFLYAKVTDLKDFNVAGKTKGFKRAKWNLSFPFSWRYIGDEKSYAKNYTKEVLLKAPFFKVKDEKESHISIQYYNEVFEYLNDKNFERIEDIFTYLSQNNNTPEQIEAYYKKIENKKIV